MAKCSNNGDCRDAYICSSASQLAEVDPTMPADNMVSETEDLQPRAEVLDADKSQKFCVVKE
ncbi:MAG: hypothetical protein RLZZ450_3661 [Pseudomonadota bacterium]|jgi:hypothetical protein